MGGLFNHMNGPLGDQLVDYHYDLAGRLETIDRDSTAPDQTWSYDPLGRLASTGWSNASAALNVSWSYTRNPASQIRTETQSIPDQVRDRPQPTAGMATSM